mgnify:CR=1 FL=1
MKSLVKAYVSPEDRTLDPSLLDSSAIERLPNPSGYRILVMPARQKSKTKGGIQILKETSCNSCCMGSKNGSRVLQR